MNVDNYLLYLAVEAFNFVSLKVIFKQMLSSELSLKQIFEDKSYVNKFDLPYKEKFFHLVENYNFSKIEEYREELNTKKTHFISYFDSNYPSKLRVTDDPPFGLFYRGNISLIDSNKNVAIVGTRKPSHYGIRVTREFAKELAANKINVVSGMAAGIDSIAHSESMKGATTAVLGTGIDVIYPPSNRRLYEKIISNGGLIISEYPLGIGAAPWNFPQRNRIISALSDDVIVIEGETQSGALITARFAIKQKKKLYAVPGPICSSLSNGPNALIKSKVAEPITSPNDVFSNEKTLQYKKKSQAMNIDSLTDEQKEIYQLLKSTKVSVDELTRETNFDITCINMSLSVLEINGYIEKLRDGSYVAK